MKNALKIVIFFAVSMCCALPATAQTAKTIVDKVINTHNAGKGISADYKVTSASGTSRGSIVMESTKYYPKQCTLHIHKFMLKSHCCQVIYRLSSENE